MNPPVWNSSNATRDAYRNEIREAKGKSWTSFCSDIEKGAEAARLNRLLARNQGGAGAGVYGKNSDTILVVPLGPHSTVLQIEIAAILQCACVARNHGRGRNIRICSDSRAASTTLGKSVTTSTLVWECYEALNKSQPVMGISNRSDTEDIKRWLAKEHQEEWCKATACKQAKTLMGEHLNPKRAVDLRRLSRTEVKTLIEVFIGHGNLAYHRHKIGLAENPLCQLCGEENETSIHTLCNCPAIRDKRQILTGYFSIDAAVIQTKNVAQFLALWHGLWGRT